MKYFFVLWATTVFSGQVCQGNNLEAINLEKGFTQLSGAVRRLAMTDPTDPVMKVDKVDLSVDLSEDDLWYVASDYCYAIDQKGYRPWSVQFKDVATDAEIEASKSNPELVSELNDRLLRRVDSLIARAVYIGVARANYSPAQVDVEDSLWSKASLKDENLTEFFRKYGESLTCDTKHFCSVINNSLSTNCGDLKHREAPNTMLKHLAALGANDTVVMLTKHYCDSDLSNSLDISRGTDSKGGSLTLSAYISSMIELNPEDKTLNSLALRLKRTGCNLN